MDTGTSVIIIAVLFFYLRLILIQRERAKRARAAPPFQRGRKVKDTPPSFAERYGILSRSKRDWVVAGAGVVLILVGVLLSVRLLPPPAAQAYWWLPVALGIAAFSFGFR